MSAAADPSREDRVVQAAFEYRNILRAGFEETDVTANRLGRS
ncbi:MAG TPA: hypothetical protein VMY78_04040 [Solirubrobacteraceae bacterium]|nr:hypothetical protein [Solirubrobacteraceae bacterium]